MTGLAWPLGDGEMVRLVRAHDWAATPLGPIEGWPQSLKTAVDIMLASGPAMQLAWGPERIFLYNDAYAPMLGDRHPGVLGAPFPEAWPEIWGTIEPLVHKVSAGETVSLENMPLVLTRCDRPEDTWWSFSYSPVRDEQAAVAGLLTVGVEATERVRALHAQAALRRSEERRELALRESEARYHALLAASPVPFMLLAPNPPDFTITAANDAYLAATLTTREGLIGRRLFDVFTDDPDRPGLHGSQALALSLDRVLRSRRTDAMPRTRYDIVTPGGGFEPHWWLAINAPVLDASGRVSAIIHQVSRVTELHLAEAAEREHRVQQAFLLKLSDTLRAETDALAIGRLATRVVGEHLRVDRCTITRLSREGGTGWGDVEYRRPGLPPMAGAMLRMGNGLLVHPDVASDPTLSGLDRQSMGAMRMGALIAAPVRRGGQDLFWTMVVATAEPRRWTRDEVGLVEDAAERIWTAMDRARAEAALRDSEARFRTLATVGSSSVYRMSPDWREMRYLDGAAFLADTQEPSVGWVDTYIPFDERPRVREAIQRAICAKQAFELEHRVLAPDGTIRWTFSRAIPLLDDTGEIAEWFGAATDVTARVKADQGFTRLFEASPAPFLVVKPDAPRFTITEVNEAYLAATMRTRDTVVGRGVFEAYPDNPDNPAGSGVSTLRASLERVLASRRPDTLPGLKYDIERPDGTFEERWWNPVNSPVLDEHGAVEAIIHNANDVTEQRHAEAALRESEERLRQFGEASQDVLWIRDVQTLQWQYLTPAFETTYGLPRSKALENDNYRSWLDLVVPEDRQQAAASIARVGAGELVTFEYRIRRPSDGAIRWLRDTDFPITNAAGQVTLIGGIGHDFTGVRETELRLQTLMEGIPQLVWRAADHGVWTWASPQWTNYTGQREAESHGSGWLGVVHPDDRALAREAWSHAVERGGFEVEYRVRNAADGQHRWFRSRAAPVHDECGDIVEWLGTSTEIHDLRELQERQQVLVAELQHRTRNLMAVVRSMSDKTARASTDIADFRNRFRDRLEALSRVQGLLSRLEEHGRVTFDELIKAELSAMIDNTQRVSLSGPAGIRLRSSTVQTLAMALHELATNAIKYGALGQPAARLAVTWSVEASGEAGRRWLHIDWRESGVEMPAAGSAPGGSGQGRELIEKALPYQLKAKTSYKLEPDGVHCRISMPVSASMAEMEHA